MSDSDKTGWPGGLGFPFMPFPSPGAARPSKEAPLASALTSGMGLLTSLWSQLPGSTQVPGFLMPTVDLDELDKRIADLRAAQSWVEVNLNLLRSTIQGLEVQRNTIAALHALSMPQAGSPPRQASPAAASVPAPVVPPAAPIEPPPAAAAVPDVAAAAPGAAVGDWLGYLQEQFAKVAQAALTVTPIPAATGASAQQRSNAAAKQVPAAKKAASRRRKAG